MTRDEIVALFARRLEAFSRLDAPTLASLHARMACVESPFAGGVAEGREAIEQVYGRSSRRSAPRRSSRSNC